MIFHIDMDYFFAQIEERENPRFAGRPLIVGADPKEGQARGVVSTCNYEARNYKIHSGMPISKAYAKCPKAIFLPVNMKLYQQVSDNIFQLVGSISDHYEKISLDEAYVDLSGIVKSYAQAKKLGIELKKIILEKESLTCSVGIGKNKMIAKIASESAKPDGLVIVKPADSYRFLTTRSIREIPGIGPKTEKRLEKILHKNNLTIKDVRSISKEQLTDTFGRRGQEIYNKVRGVDNTPVIVQRKTQSVGREKTFQKDISDSKKIIETFRELVSEISTLSLVKKRDVKTVVVTCRFTDFKTLTRQISFQPRIINSNFLYQKGVNLLLHLLSANIKPIRLIGLRVIFKNKKN